jgi:hypothetical protein
VLKIIIEDIDLDEGRGLRVLRSDDRLLKNSKCSDHSRKEERGRGIEYIHEHVRYPLARDLPLECIEEPTMIPQVFDLGNRCAIQLATNSQLTLRYAV